jgi:hypothetical protein
MSGGVSRISPSPERRRALLRTDACSIVNERTKRDRAEASCHGHDVGIRTTGEASRSASHPFWLLQSRRTTPAVPRRTRPRVIIGWASREERALVLDCFADAELALVGRIESSIASSLTRCGAGFVFAIRAASADPASPRRSGRMRIARDSSHDQVPRSCSIVDCRISLHPLFIATGLADAVTR